MREELEGKDGIESEKKIKIMNFTVLLFI